jgi:cobalt-zinc-cadmium efflux system outer membrane protein
MAQVERSNLELAAQRANVPIATAQIAIARIFPDPIITLGVNSYDVSAVGAQNALGMSATIPVEFPTKRSARISVAMAQRAAAVATLEDALRTLRGEAAGAYIDALYTRLVLRRKQATLASLEQLVAANMQRLRAGDVGEIVVVQSRVEAERFRSEVLAAEGHVRAADLALLLQSGARQPLPAVSRFDVAGDLRIAPRAFDAAVLIARALAARPDVRARRFEVAAAQARVDLAHANRWVDIAVNLGWQYNTVGAQGSAFQAPPYQTVAASVSVPIPFSRVYRGEFDAALAGQTQADAQLRAAELRVEVEIRQALARYAAAVARMSLYTGSLLADADRVLASTLYNFQRGGATLLEVLNAQRTVNEVYLACYDALADHARQLIAVEQAAAMWDVQF